MPERVWQRAAGYAFVVAVAALSYYFAQTAIDSRRVALPVIEYINCLNKLQNHDWSGFQGAKPPIGETCTALAGREPLGS